MTAPLPEVLLRPRGSRRFRGPHPWVFRDDVAEVRGARTGDLVRVLSDSRRPLGTAFFSERSKIAIRRVGRDGGELPDWASRVERALEHRRRVVPADVDAYRLLFSESDDVPGFVADVYGRHVVVQSLGAGADRVCDEIVGALSVRLAPESILARNDPAARALEGLPREVRQLRGKTPERIEVTEHGVRYLAEPWTGQKTGAFLDQRENRAAAAGWVRGRILDAFAYHGSFALHAAARADEVVVLDSSSDALARARDNAVRNAIRNLVYVEANAFDELRRRERAGERFDAVLLDPPAFAKSRKDVAAARRGYKEINLRAMRLLSDGGILVTSSCSYNLSESEFLEVLAEAAADARRDFRILEKRTQSRDHPIRLGFPESHYLKCLVMRMM